MENQKLLNSAEEFVLWGNSFADKEIVANGY
jgi:hypothetical protein